MDTLLRVICAYASQQRIPSLLPAYQSERWQLEREFSAAVDAVSALGEEGRTLSRRLEEGHSALAALDEEVAVLAGLSIGLELGRV